MTQQEEDFKLEGMVWLTMSKQPDALDGCPPEMVEAVQNCRIAYNRLMLVLAVKLEAGK